MTTPWLSEMLEAFQQDMQRFDTIANMFAGGYMPMQLSTDDLRAIADQVDKLESTGITIKEFYVRGHNVMLKYVDDPKEDNTIYIVGINNRPMRGGASHA